MLRYFLVAAMWFVLGGNVVQVPHKFSGWIFQAPPGWHADVSKEDVVMVPLDLAPQEVEAGEAVGIVLYPGQKLTPAFRTWLEQAVVKLKTKAVVLEEGVVDAAETRQGIPTLSLRLVLRYPDGKTLHRLIWAAQLGQRVEYLMFVTTNHELYQRYRGVLQEFLQTVCFVKSPCPESTPLAQKQWPQVPVPEQAHLLVERVAAFARLQSSLELDRGGGSGRRER